MSLLSPAMHSVTGFGSCQNDSFLIPCSYSQWCDRIIKHIIFYNAIIIKLTVNKKNNTRMYTSPRAFNGMTYCISGYQKASCSVQIKERNNSKLLIYEDKLRTKVPPKDKLYRY